MSCKQLHMKAGELPSCSTYLRAATAAATAVAAAAAVTAAVAAAAPAAAAARRQRRHRSPPTQRSCLNLLTHLDCVHAVHACGLEHRVVRLARGVQDAVGQRLAPHQDAVQVALCRWRAREGGSVTASATRGSGRREAGRGSSGTQNKTGAWHSAAAGKCIEMCKCIGLRAHPCRSW